MRVIGIAGWSGSGKTTLIERVVPVLIGRGLDVSVIKHAHHGFDLDRPGKDSYRHREAGAKEVLITSGGRWALMHELRGAAEPTLAECLARMCPCDLVLVEGYKALPIPKLEVWRAANGKPPLFPDDPSIIGLATDSVPPLQTQASPPLPKIVPLDDAGAIATFVDHNALEFPPSVAR